ncbi:unnamed protein product [Alternaria alternata]
MLAPETKEQAFVMEVYARIIKYLEPRRSVGHIRNHLADFYRNVILDAKKAKELWLEIQQRSCISATAGAFRATNPSGKRYLSVSNVIYHQFTPLPPHARKSGCWKKCASCNKACDGSPRRPSTPACYKSASGEEFRGKAGSSTTSIVRSLGEYIRGPVDGWQGIRRGVMTIEREKTEFQKWLKEIKGKKWPLAWERFWKREDGIENIL